MQKCHSTQFRERGQLVKKNYFHQKSMTHLRIFTVSFENIYHFRAVHPMGTDIFSGIGWLLTHSSLIGLSGCPLFNENVDIHE